MPSSFSLQNSGVSSLALLTVEDSAAMDTAAQELSETLPEKLMRHAGWEAAQEILKHYAPCRVVVACGPGNNGGDGYVLAQHLQEAGWHVAVAQALPPVSALAQHMAAAWKGDMVPFAPKEAQQADLVVDAVFGAGLSRPLAPEISAFFAAARQIVALDVPSGIDGNTGEGLGKVAACERTVAFVRKRPGHLLLPGAEKCGVVSVADIGMPSRAAETVAITTWENVPGLWKLPRHHPNDNKYTRGVVSICGGRDMPGAAWLATAGARRSGCGLARLVVAPASAENFRFGAPGVIVDAVPLEKVLMQKHRSTWVCGPGLLPEEAGEIFPQLVKSGKTIVADAGTLGWAKEAPDKLKGAAVLTPHEGEFIRVFGPLGADRCAAARKAAALVGAVVVLKGYTTVIAAPDGRVALNTHATPALATAGSGDVLSGVVGTCLAAGLPHWEAACAAVWLHGEAGRQAASAEGGWPVAEDIAAHMGRARGAAAKMQEKHDKK